MRTCESPTCGNVIPPQKGSARPRKYCTACRPPRNRPNPRLVTLDRAERADGPRDAPTAPLLAEHPIVVQYRQRLTAAGRLDTTKGAVVMHLAALFAAGQHTAAGAAALSRQLLAAEEAALAGAKTQADAMDELEARRRHKVSSA